jgi:DNA primase
VSLSTAFLDELRARTTLSAIIAPSVKLTKAGREYKACCPFHQEKTPSFTINDEKGFYHCFGCGAHGDAIRFLTDARGLPFMDAVKELAGKAGIDVPAPDPRAQARQEQSAGLYDVMAAAQLLFAEQLAGIEGAAAREYLTKRGIDAGAVQRFGIGFAPDSRGKLKAALAAFDEEKLVESGMLIRPDDGKPSYDRFRGRLMIPIRDPRGRVIAFGGRILGPGEPKYLNSPETPLFDKGRTLYNLDLASPASRAAGRVIVVEGYMDVIGLDRAGIREAVAPNGTALTEAQLERMWRLEPAPTATAPGKKPRSAPRPGPCPTLHPTRPCASSRFPRARTPTMWSARAAARQSRHCSLPPNRWSSGCGATRSRPPRSTRRKRAQDYASGSATMPRPSPTPTSVRCTATTGCGGSTLWSARRPRPAAAVASLGGRRGRKARTAAIRPPSYRRDRACARSARPGSIARPLPRC